MKRFKWEIKYKRENEETGELGYNPVEELFQRETDETYHVKVNGTTIITTAEHPFWVAGEGWVEARDLKEGDKLVELDDQEVPIEDIDVKKERKFYSCKITMPPMGLEIWCKDIEVKR
ncbi:polymorphic toxin-type HINT domain-containing protein [Paenibacillus apiarius]|uniref:HINT domain-containing protein n=1 Tax=Paenibacillus apiarius TaxID=46240 RepID=A0ABT4E1H8_9BACL|nr:polymorphic toxin-type HINT domain-containing protein [Paenibacillus apiarius]MCY9517757.1 HINT domain-containing protein [Paenibacillus apiarius]MCY9523457.1 HINT domain-containing protein [Paenibacillus apiarius]MCY9554955.1 HINT domain-containing protein [Paenibacillus apiarius]MCY9561551.1 HINT domain-containing protein [Paenibacillus apiarius]MCY9682225.1 HINT domain-containing protein [Paenibacillus apiarius]